MRALIHKGKAATLVVDVPVGTHYAGAEVGCLLQVTDPGVRARHARLKYQDDGRLTVADLGAEIGIRVNGERVVRADLKDRDVLRIGTTEIRFARDLPPTSGGTPIPGHLATGQVDDSAFRAVARRVHQRLIAQLDLRRRDVSSMSDRTLRELASDLLRPIVAEEAAHDSIDPESLRRFVLDEALGLGPLEELLADDTIREIMINGADTIFVEREGRMERAARTFSSETALRGIVERIAGLQGTSLVLQTPWVNTSNATASYLIAARRVALDSTVSASASRISCEVTRMVFGRPATESRPLTSIESSSSSG